MKTIKTSKSLQPEVKSIQVELNYDNSLPNKNQVGRNSVIHEIDAIRQKNIETNIDYYDKIDIDVDEYKESLELVGKLSARLCENHIIDIKSTKKPFFVFENVFELYSTVIGEPFISWKDFRDKVNLPEMSLTFKNVNYNRFTKDILNKLLVKIVAMKRFENYLSSENTASLFFTWIKAVSKISIYLSKTNKKEKPNVKMNTSKEKTMLDEKNNETNRQVIDIITNSAKKLYSPDYEEHTNEDIYLTGIKPLKTTCTQTLTRWNTNSEKLALVNKTSSLVHQKYIYMDYNCLIDKRRRDLKVIESLPLHKFKTFNKLREYYNGKNATSFKELISKNTVDIKHKALSNPENFEKVMSMVSEGKYGIEHQVTTSLFDHFKMK
jgi:hypothetical protein